MNSVTKLTRFLKACIYSLGPRRDFIVRTGGKVYSLEDSVEDCKIIGGHIMIINYLEVFNCQNWIHLASLGSKDN